MERQVFFVDNGQGWELCLKRSVDRTRLVRGRQPVAIFPGYGMNAFIFGYHPRGQSMIDCWVARGHEVWTVEVRGQGGSLRHGGSWDFGLADLAFEDVPRAAEAILTHTLTGADRLTGVGCSLGGGLLYSYVATRPVDHLLGGLVAMGAPLRWEQVHPVFRLLIRPPGLARLGGWLSRRELAMKVLPLAARIPGMISIYLHPEMVDLTQAERLFLTVNDLHPRLNAELAQWMRQRDLTLRGQNVTAGFLASTVPLLCVVGVSDGVVPEPAAVSACRRPATVPTELLRVGDAARPYAHADLFVGNDAVQDVFLPVARWLERTGQQPVSPPGPAAG